MLKKTLVLSTLLLFSGCVERGYQLNVNSSTQTITAEKIIDLRSKDTQTITDDIREMQKAVQKEQKKQIYKKNTEHIENNHYTQKKEQLQKKKKESDALYRLKQEAEKKALAEKEKKERTLLLKKHEAEKKAQMLKNKQRKEQLAIQAKKEKDALERKLDKEKKLQALNAQKALKKKKEKKARLAQIEKAQKEKQALLLKEKKAREALADKLEKEKQAKALKTAQEKKRLAKKMQDEKNALERKLAQEKKQKEIKAKKQKEKADKALAQALKKEKAHTPKVSVPLSNDLSLIFTPTTQTYQKFGTSEIHGHVVYLTPEGSEVTLKNTKIYLVLQNRKVEYWYTHYYLKNKESNTLNKTSISYLNATHLNIEKNFAFYGLAIGNYYVIIESEYPRSMAKNKKVYIAKKIRVEKYKKIMTVFSKKL